MNNIPRVIEETSQGERSSDIYSRMLQERIIFIEGEITNLEASLVISQLLYLEGQDANKDIQIYINSSGGDLASSMAIYDTMQFIKPDITTICMGMAASTGAVLLSSGTKGKRMALPNSEVMLHQPLGSYQGTAADLNIYTDYMIRMRQKLTEIIANNSGKTFNVVYSDLERDYFMSADEALDYGLIDRVIAN